MNATPVFNGNSGCSYKAGSLVYFNFTVVNLVVASSQNIYIIIP